MVKRNLAKKIIVIITILITILGYAGNAIPVRAADYDSEEDLYESVTLWEVIRNKGDAKEVSMWKYLLYFFGKLILLGITKIGDAINRMAAVWLGAGDASNVTQSSDEFFKETESEVALTINNDDAEISAYISHHPADSSAAQETIDGENLQHQWGESEDTDVVVPNVRVTPLTLFSNQVPLLNANYFSNGSNGDLKTVISQWYNVLRLISIVGLLSVLVYVGIRMVLSSIASEKAKYKTMLMDWIIALCLVFCLHYIMAFVMTMVEEITATLSKSADKISVTIVNIEHDPNSSQAKQAAKDEKSERKSLSKKIEKMAQGDTTLSNGSTTLPSIKNGYIGNAKIKKALDNVLGAQKLSVNDISDVRADLIAKGINDLANSKKDNLTVEEYEKIIEDALKDVNNGGNSNNELNKPNQENNQLLSFNNITIIDGIKRIASLASAPDMSFSTNLTGLIRIKCNYSNLGEKAMYVLMYLSLTFYTVYFIVIYFKRLLMLTFLTFIAPLVALTYPIDKIKDGRAQAFNYWLREYIINAMLPIIHLILYIVFVSSAQQLVVEHPIYAIFALAFIVPGEKIVREMFGFNSSTAPKAGGLLAAAAIGNALKSAGNRAAGHIGNGKGDRGGDKPPRQIDRSSDDSDSDSDRDNYTGPSDPGEVGEGMDDDGREEDDENNPHPPEDNPETPEGNPETPEGPDIHSQPDGDEGTGSNYESGDDDTYDYSDWNDEEEPEELEEPEEDDDGGSEIRAFIDTTEGPIIVTDDSAEGPGLSLFRDDENENEELEEPEAEVRQSEVEQPDEENEERLEEVPESDEIPERDSPELEEPEDDDTLESGSENRGVRDAIYRNLDKASEEKEKKKVKFNPARYIRSRFKLPKGGKGVAVAAGRLAKFAGRNLGKAAIYTTTAAVGGMVGLAGGIVSGDLDNIFKGATAGIAGGVVLGRAGAKGLNNILKKGPALNTRKHAYRTARYGDKKANDIEKNKAYKDSVYDFLDDKGYSSREIKDRQEAFLRLKKLGMSDVKKMNKVYDRYKNEGLSGKEISDRLSFYKDTYKDKFGIRNLDDMDDEYKAATKDIAISNLSEKEKQQILLDRANGYKDYYDAGLNSLAEMRAATEIEDEEKAKIQTSEKYMNANDEEKATMLKNAHDINVGIAHDAAQYSKTDFESKKFRDNKLKGDTEIMKNNGISHASSKAEEILTKGARMKGVKVGRNQGGQRPQAEPQQPAQPPEQPPVSQNPPPSNN